jgi:hypothetical protein
MQEENQITKAINDLIEEIKKETCYEKSFDENRIKKFLINLLYNPELLLFLEYKFFFEDVS